MDNRFFAIKNPWRSGQSVKPPAIRRTCLDDLDRWLKDSEVVVVYGPRRVGKSTLLLSIVAELLKYPDISPQDIFFFDLDTLDCSDVLATPATLIDFIGMPQHLRRPTLSRSLRSFAAAYAPAQLTVVNLSLEAETAIDCIPVHFRKFPECMA